jgi:hypothetical protein
VDKTADERSGYHVVTISRVLPEGAKQVGHTKVKQNVKLPREDEVAAEDDEDKEIWQMKPEQYQTEELERYPAKFLIKIINLIGRL